VELVGIALSSFFCEPAKVDAARVDATQRAAARLDAGSSATAGSD
jgi:hypothetical protein